MTTTNTMMPYAVVTTHPYLMQQAQQQLCRYRSKVCTNPRTHKRDGSLHRYCEDHRQRANANQKKWASRRMQAVDAGDFQALQLAYEQHQLQYQQELVNAHASFSPISVTTDALDGTHELLSIDEDLDTTLAQFELDGDELWTALGLETLDVASDCGDATGWTF